MFGGAGTWALLTGGVLGFSLGESGPSVGWTLLAFGGLSGLFSLTLPSANRGLYLGLTVITAPVGFVVSFLILAVLFYSVFTPVGLFFRVLGRDPLGLKFERGRSSYWVRRASGRPDPERYFRQY